MEPKAGLEAGPGFLSISTNMAKVSMWIKCHEQLHMEHGTLNTSTKALAIISKICFIHENPINNDHGKPKGSITNTHRIHIHIYIQNLGTVKISKYHEHTNAEHIESTVIRCYVCFCTKYKGFLSVSCYSLVRQSFI